MGFLKFIMITIMVLWLIRMIIRLVFPLLLRNIFGKMQQQANHGGGHSRPQPQKPEGSISIDYMPPQPKPGNPDKMGDFVDYEEVK